MFLLGTILRRHVSILLIIISFLANLVQGQQEGGSERTPKKSPGLSADIYEKEEEPIKSFSAHVNLIRETDTIEVFFDGAHKGPFVLKDDPNLGSFKAKLIKSQKNKNQNVTVKVSNDVITSVELVENKAAEKKKSDMDSVLDDILKK